VGITRLKARLEGASINALGSNLKTFFNQKFEPKYALLFGKEL